MATINLDLTGRKGLANRLSQESYKTTAEPHLNYSVPEGGMASGIYNPLMRPGYLYPANTNFLTVEVPTITNEFTCSIVDPEIGVIFGNQDDFFYRYDDSFTSGVTYTYESLDGVKIESVSSGGSDAPMDMETYVVNGQKKVFYVTLGGSNGNVGIAEPDLSGADNNWLSTVCTGGTTLSTTGLRAFLVKADNGLLYIMDGYKVHSIEGRVTGGANGTANMGILVFPEELFEITDAIDTKGKLFIAINETSTAHSDLDDKTLTESYLGKSGVYVWNRVSSEFSMQDFVTVESCMRINKIWVDFDGNIFLMTIGSNGMNQIRIFDGNSFVIVKELPYETKISVRDGLLVADGYTWWAANDGYIYAGKFEDGSFNVFKIAQYTTNALSSAMGAVLAFSVGNSFTAATGYRTARAQLHIAYRDSGANAKVKKYYIYGTGTITDDNGSDGSAYISPITFTPNQGDVYTGVILLPTMSTVKDVIIRCIPTSTGSTTIATIKYYFNGSSTVGMTKTVTLDDASRGYVQHSLNKPFVNSIQMEIEWATGVTMGNNDFAPYLATIDYAATTTNTKDRG